MIQRLFFVSALSLVLSFPCFAAGSGKHHKEENKIFKQEELKKEACQKKQDDALSEKALKKAHFYLEHADALELTDKQKETLIKLKTDLKKKLIKDQAEIDTAKVDLKTELYKEKLDAIKLHSLIDKKYELKKGMAKASVEALVAIKNVPTPEQQEKAKEIWKACKQSKKACCSKN